MRDLDKALADITKIRSQIAQGSMFRGFGPSVIALSGFMALLTAIAQAIWPSVLAATPEIYFGLWISVASASAIMVGVEMLARSRRHHGGLADAMLINAIELFLPAGIAGAGIGAVLYQFAPESLWLLPGLWQILVALGLFASLRNLPETISWVAGWYFVAGITVLMIASQDRSLSPWLMGLPFAVGQVGMAAALHMASGDTDAETE